MANRHPVFETPFDTYQVTSIIGEGGAGRVYEVKNLVGEIYALKCLAHERITSERIKRFKNEIAFCQRQDHRNVLKVLDAGATTIKSVKCPFYVMQRFNGTLRSQIQQLTPEKGIGVFGQLLDGVEAAHFVKVWHRDLKPENILWNEQDNSFVVADFGVAHFEEEELYTAVETKAAARLANFLYAAPEQRVRGMEVDHRADVFSLGLMLNELFTKTVPHGTNYPLIADIAPKLAFLDAIVAQMLRQSPLDRPTSIAAVKTLIQKHQSEAVVLQKLSEMSQTVVPVGEIDEPLALNPPRLVNCDWLKGQLILHLDRPVNPDWVKAFQHLRNQKAVAGKSPRNFRFQDNTATIVARENEVQRIVDYFKQWLPAATEKLRDQLLQKIHDIERNRKLRLRDEREAEEKRLRIIQNVKI